MSIRRSQILSMAIIGTLVATAAAAQVVDPKEPTPQPVPPPVYSDVDRSMTFGVKAGVNYSTLALEESDVLPVTYVWGGIGGVSIGQMFSENIGFQLEALYSQRGAKDDVDGADATARLTFVDIPMTVSMGSSTMNGGRFHVFTGPQFGIKVKAEIINDMLDTTSDLDDQIKSWDFGWTVGAGLDMHPVTLDVRYTFGLTDLNATGDGGWTRNRTATALLGIKFR